jgi:hypothetical protein
VDIALKNAKNTVPVSMLQDIHLPDEPLLDPMIDLTVMFLIISMMDTTQIMLTTMMTSLLSLQV